MVVITDNIENTSNIEIIVIDDNINNITSDNKIYINKIYRVSTFIELIYKKNFGEFFVKSCCICLCIIFIPIIIYSIAFFISP